MCGRIIATQPGEVLQHRFHAEFKGTHWSPTYNGAPSQQLPIILNTVPQEIVLSHWGIMPAWMKEKKGGRELINARAEGLPSKRTFMRDFNEHRCLVLADGFYEWQQTDSGRIPFLIRRKDKEPFAFAGLWRFQDSEHTRATSFVIITVEPNTMMEKIHNRMPAMLLPEKETPWLDTSLPLDAVERLLIPYPVELLTAFEVSKMVNSPANNSPAVIEPVPTY